MGRRHDALRESGYVGHDLQVFLVRVVFCLFADDTGIFEPRDVFGELFAERLTIPDFDAPMRAALLDACRFDWAAIVAFFFSSHIIPLIFPMTAFSSESAAMPSISIRFFNRSIFPSWWIARLAIAFNTRFGALVKPARSRLITSPVLRRHLKIGDR